MRRGALEHQMFEEVREPGFTGVSSAEPTLYQIICVTTGVRLIGDHHDLHAVGKREAAVTFRR